MKHTTLLLLVLVGVFVVLVNSQLKLPDQAVVQLYPCTSGSFRQQWDISYLSTDQTLRLSVAKNCLDISGYGTQDPRIWLYGCHTNDKDSAHQNQEFIWDSSAGTIKSTLLGKCIGSPTGSYRGATIELMTCTADTPSQHWVFNKTDQTIRNQAAGLCLDAGAPLARACDADPGKSLPFCDTSLSRQARVDDLVKRILPAEKIKLFGNGASAVPSLGIPGYQWWSEALHGVGGSPGVSFRGTTPVATSFPQVCLTGATFDTELFHIIGSTISTEARAFSNAGNAGLTFWAPNLNIFRDPRWGRGQETPGEDPYLTSEYVRHFVTGLQVGDDPNYLKVSSCCKHYAAYSLEKYNGMDRHHYNAIVTAQDLADTYFPAFQSCISPDGGAASGIMCSYNSVNGIPSCADSYLLTDTARNTWKFDGYITGDCGAVDDVQNTHKYTTNPDDTCAAVLKAGTDIDCGSFLPDNLQHAIQTGAVNSTLIDRALKNLFAVQMRLGMFDPLTKQPYTQIQPSAVNTPASQVLAEKVALEGIVLLRNDKDVLPLSSKTTVAAIGPHASATNAMQGNYAGKAPFLISPAAGLAAYYNVTTTQGTTISGTSTSGFGAACDAAAKASATILFVGIDQSIESEGLDRVAITLPGVQDSLITHVAGCAAGKPVVVVVLSGSSVDLSLVKSNPNVSAILWAGYPGQSGGSAIAKIISGVSASGRLPFTIYNAAYVNQISFLDMGMRPTGGGPGRTYRFFTGTPVYAFGFGLSYTTFDFQWSTMYSEIQRDQIDNQISTKDYSMYSAIPLASQTVIVTNTGKVASDLSVLCFVVGPDPGKNGNPLKQLVGFQRVVQLTPGSKKQITFPVSAHHLSYVGEDGKMFSVGGVWSFVVEGVTTQINVI